MAETVLSKSVQRRLAIQQGDPPVERTILAEAIVKISKAAEDLVRSGLNERAIIVLLADKTNLSRGSVKDLLRGLSKLREDYCR